MRMEEYPSELDFQESITDLCEDKNVLLQPGEPHIHCRKGTASWVWEGKRFRVECVQYEPKRDESRPDVSRLTLFKTESDRWGNETETVKLNKFVHGDIGQAEAEANELYLRCIRRKK